MKILLLGNCQTETLRQILGLRLPGVRVTRVAIDAALKPKAIQPQAHDAVLLQDHPGLAPLRTRLAAHPRLITFANIAFAGYHADMVGLHRRGQSAIAFTVSGIAMGGWRAGLSPEECEALYTDAFIARLNYARLHALAREQLIAALDRNGMNGRFHFEKWQLQAPFMMNIGHPRLHVLEDVARHLADRLALPWLAADCASLVVNQGRRGDQHPTCNHDPALGNALVRRDATFHVGMRPMGRLAFTRRCHAQLTEHAQDIDLPQARLQVFDAALAAHREAAALPPGPPSGNPYTGLPTPRFWKPAVAQVPASQLAPVHGPTPVIAPVDKVATAGSCFAQHIARTLVAQGMNYHVAEAAPPDLPADEAQRRQFGLFSARYGNVYTARQLLQLTRAAFGRFKPSQPVWTARSGRCIDALRPNVGDEFDTPAEVLAARREHLAAVRRMFRTLDVFVFTLGLTEAWTSVDDGAVYPVAPGVVSVHDDPWRFRFHNFTAQEIQDDMVEFLGLLWAANPRAKVVLTVSPVPLIATYEARHVLESTTYSKSVLRTVAQRLADGFAAVHYFPSYEIITGHYNRGEYFEPDLRSVTPAGVQHVMGVFTRNFVGATEVEAAAPAPVVTPADEALLGEVRASDGIVCDEELIVTQR